MYHFNDIRVLKFKLYRFIQTGLLNFMKPFFTIIQNIKTNNFLGENE